MLGQRITLFALSASLLVSACSSESDAPPRRGPDTSATTVDTTSPTRTEPIEIALVPGESLGPVTLGMTYSSLVDAIGEPDSSFAFQRIVTVTYKRYQLEVVLASSDPNEATPDARVVSITTLPGAKLIGTLTHGASRAEAIEVLGHPTAESRGVSHFPSAGMAAKFNAEDRVVQLAIWTAYDLITEPPEMLPAATSQGPPLKPVNGAEPVTYEIDGVAYEVVDMHLHTGRVTGQFPDGVSFLLNELPAPALMNFPATSGLVLDPWSEHLGIKEHLTAAGVAHGVILATYTQHTIGYATNRLVESMLDDPRNVNPDGSRWAWGMVSINFDDFDDPAVRESRLEALASYFAARPDLFIGIKLAHAHQSVRFDDPAYLGVYDIAAKYGVPVLLHTGFSPFPHSMTAPEYYDPASLESIVQMYDGTRGPNRVEFVLAHSGQGDARATEHSFQLASHYDNVWLELSAIHRPLLIDTDGNPVDEATPRHQFVLEEIKKRGLTHRAIYGTDGPQYFGKAQSYLSMLVNAMRALDYTPDELKAVLAGNFYDCFAPARY